MRQRAKESFSGFLISHLIGCGSRRVATAESVCPCVFVRSPTSATSRSARRRNKKGMSYAHVNYNHARRCPVRRRWPATCPQTATGARPYFEREANKHGVACQRADRRHLIIALPLELLAIRCTNAIERFMDKIGHGRIAWLACLP